MGMFSFLKDRKMYPKSLMLLVYMIDEVNPELARQAKADQSSVDGALVKKHIVELIKSHYYEDLRPPVQWNYNVVVKSIANIPEKFPQVVFWDANGKIVKQAAYREFCGLVRNSWKLIFPKVYPKYSRAKMEDGFENVNFDYYPDEGVLIASTIMKQLLPKDGKGRVISPDI